MINLISLEGNTNENGQQKVSRLNGAYALQHVTYTVYT